MNEPLSEPLPRFYVGTTEGFLENSGEGQGYSRDRHQPLHLTAHVIDRYDAHRVIDAFRSDYLHRGSREANRAAAIANAEAVAAEWNEWDRDPSYIPAKHGRVRLIERGCTCSACLAAAAGRRAARQRRTLR